jgi:hypothetical protein
MNKIKNTTIYILGVIAIFMGVFSIAPATTIAGSYYYPTYYDYTDYPYSNYYGNSGAYINQPYVNYYGNTGSYVTQPYYNYYGTAYYGNTQPYYGYTGQYQSSFQPYSTYYNPSSQYYSSQQYPYYYVPQNNYPQYPTTSYYPYPYPQYNEPLAATCYPEVASTNLGNYVTWRVVSTGGSHQYTYSWTGEGINPSAHTGDTITTYYYVPGQKTLELTVESAGVRITKICGPVFIRGGY